MNVALLWKRLERVLDPELDESIVRLGFVRNLEWDGRTVRVVLRLPTYWCSANFAYLMLDGVRRELGVIPEVQSVRVELEGHFADQILSEGVSAGQSFRALFPSEAEDDVEEVRRRFLVKGYLSRLLVFVRAWQGVGVSANELCTASLGDLEVGGEMAWLRTGELRRGPIREQITERYVTRRAELGLPMQASSPLLLLPDGRELVAEELEQELRRLRVTVINLRASTALCEALLASRQQWWNGERKEAAR